MKNECNIIRDILPLYAENMVSPDTASFVEEHLKDCDACRKEYAGMKESQTAYMANDAAPLFKLKKKMTVKKVQTIALTALFVMTLLVSAFALLDAPVYLPYSEGLIRVEAVGECGVRISFDESVTDFSYVMVPTGDGGNSCDCNVEAWYSLWDRWFSTGKRERSVIVFPRESNPINVIYVPNNGSENICVYGEARSEGTVTLPRLTLGYYFVMAALAFAVLFILRLALRKKSNLRIWAEQATLYPVSYMVSHFIVAGFRFVSYAMPRDFLLIVFISILLYCGLLLAHSIWRLRKEIAEVNHKT